MRIGRLIPWTIGLALALDAATRMIPIDMFSFRAWETLVVARGPTGPFEPDRVYANPLTYGDLARDERYAPLRQHRFEYFSTDHWGFRNTVPGSPDRPVRWLLVGDSFGVSSGVGDGSSLASQIARESGDRVYNGSASLALFLSDIRFTAERLGMTAGGVIYEFMERQEMPTFAPGAESARQFTDGPAPSRQGLGERFRKWRKDGKVDRLGILAGWAWESLAARIDSGAADSGLPADLRVARYELANGQTMLFFGPDIERARDPDRRISTDYLVWLKSELAKRNLDLVVLLVPTKYSVYGPLVKDPSAVRPSGLPLARVAARLQAQGVFAVNVTDPLCMLAASGLPRNEYDYFLDDTHWNDRGIGAAAQALVQALKAR
jgi:SGNH hydrolase-like domain, acetyltransferase AlgX